MKIRVLQSTKYYFWNFIILQMLAWKLWFMSNKDKIKFSKSIWLSLWKLGKLNFFKELSIQHLLSCSSKIDWSTKVELLWAFKRWSWLLHTPVSICSKSSGTMIRLYTCGLQAMWEDDARMKSWNEGRDSARHDDNKALLVNVP